MAYDRDNIFAKILRGEIPCDKVYEDEFVLAFRDIAPQASEHVLVIPKGEYISWADFSTQASPEEIVAFTRATGKIANELQANGTTLQDGGYRLISNHGRNANQEVPHFHVHILGGQPLGALLAKS